ADTHDAAEDFQGVADDFVEVHGLNVQTVVLAKGEKLAGKVGRLFADGDDFFQLGEKRVVRAECFLAEVCQPDHDGDEVVEVVDRATGEPADQFEALRFLQLVFEAALQGHVDDEDGGDG